MSFIDKAKDLIGQNVDKVEAAIEKAGDAIDAKTEGKFAGAVDKAQQAAKDAAQKLQREGDTSA